MSSGVSVIERSPPACIVLNSNVSLVLPRNTLPIPVPVFTPVFISASVWICTSFEVEVTCRCLEPIPSLMLLKRSSKPFLLSKIPSPLPRFDADI